MKNTFGNSLTLTLFGESHGEAIGCVIDGLAPGVEINIEEIEKQLKRRRPAGVISTSRVEPDEFSILSGAFEGKTTGTPLCIVIKNVNKQSADYKNFNITPRPSHADYPAHIKYGGYEDYRGGGHFSGRITAPLVAAGGIIIPALKKKNIEIISHIKSLHGITDDSFGDFAKDKIALDGADFPVLNSSKGEKMTDEIKSAARSGNSVGGIVETAVTGVPSGIGEPWFDTVEGVLSHALFSIPAIKGVEFGKGFELTDMYGSESNDPYRIKGAKIITEKNDMGGISGGITNGMPITFSCAVKPTPSISTPQKTVDIVKNENADLTISGRHDPAIVHRALPVIESVTALVIADLLTSRFGTNYLGD